MPGLKTCSHGGVDLQYSVETGRVQRSLDSRDRPKPRQVLMWVEAWSTQRKIMNDKLLYRIPEVAEHLSISRSKVYELLKSGELRSVHIDRSRLVRARDLQAYVDSLAAAS